MLRIVVGTGQAQICVCPVCDAKFLPEDVDEMFRHETAAHRTSLHDEPVYTTLHTAPTPVLLLPGPVGRRIDRLDQKRPLRDALLADLAKRC